jgi:hypothetical protein
VYLGRRVYGSAYETFLTSAQLKTQAETMQGAAVIQFNRQITRKRVFDSHQRQIMLRVIFWVVPRRVVFNSLCFGTM